MTVPGFDSQSLIWAVIAFALCAGGFYFAFRSWARARVIEDTPTAKIRSASQGYLELAGRAELMRGESVRAPLTGSECCWYSFKVERQGNRNSWNKVDGGASNMLFLLKDETGACMIDPDGAEVTPSERNVWYGRSRTPTQRPSRARSPVRGSLLEHWGIGDMFHVSLVRGRYRYTEERIHGGDPLYAIGLFKTLGETDHRRDRAEATRVLLRGWKANHSELIARFDANNDGEIDLQEWDRVRATAEARVTRKHAEQPDYQVLHTLSRTRSARRPFLLSSLQQFALVRRYRVFALASLAGFLIGGISLVWIVSLRLVV